MTLATFQLEDNHTYLLSNVIKKYINTGLTYGWKANTRVSYDQGHWNKQILKNSSAFPCDLSKTPYVKRHPELEILWNNLSSNFSERALFNCYVNGYTFGTDGYAHYDNNWVNKKHGEQVLTETIIIYLNEKWHYDWCGETVIFDDNKEILASLLPKYGRVLIFDSKYLHAARPVSRICTVLRSVLVFKTVEPKIISKPVLYLTENTASVSHSGKTFFEHLFNTMIVLEERRNEDEILLAGLYHSIYGTEHFKHNNNVSRDFVREMIGEYAESLVYEFCNMKNRYNKLLNNENNYNDKMYLDLVEMEIANLIEQNVNQKYEAQIFQLEQIKKK